MRVLDKIKSFFRPLMHHLCFILVPCTPAKRSKLIKMTHLAPNPNLPQP